ncbi:hypothetical protein K504DRAFT_537797 [Pleomassaria siparia CBS 279.74]|uniref:NADP-dependent oxidoreductase domain-containing protein n=1 Tax=Pleomassaria siparia CBS 279.74 TaxID=1314801 RepID=A0A6G1JX49_9PLEO|nr:hypothetical protein K504DRAFT_537797 [Pleomassaria siparia CBS 279.74]
MSLPTYFTFNTGAKISAVAFNGTNCKLFPPKGNGVFDLADVDSSVTYTAMEELLESEKVHTIGVSNFTVSRLNNLLGKTKVVPAVNQVEAHSYLRQSSLFDFYKSKKILIEAYSPLGNNQTGEV